MNALTILSLLLKLAAFFARQADKRDVERAVLNELEILHGKRVRGALDARDDVLSGRVQPDDLDPYRRD